MQNILRQEKFALEDLEIVAPAGSVVDFQVGDPVMLNSGGPKGLIVDLPAKDTVTVAWPGNDEIELPAACLTLLPS